MVHFVTALHCEARPLIDSYGMKPISNHGRVSIYSSENATLAISGVGILQSAIGATALQQTNADASGPWINVGICGHRDLPIGEAILASKVSSGRHPESFYPRLITRSGFTQIGIETIDAPTNDYPETNAVDMEAYGFFQACSHFTTLERIQSIKIVSDNAAENAERQFDKKWVSELIGNHIDAIKTFARTIETVTRDPQPRSSIEKLESELLAAHHYSVTEQHQLKSRLNKLAFLHSEETLPDPAALASKPKTDAAQAIDKLINQRSPVAQQRSSQR